MGGKKKRFHGLVALAVTLAVALGLVTPAFAATITVNQSETGHNYKAYQVLAATVTEEPGHMNVQLSDVQWGKDIDGAKLLEALKSTGTGAVGETTVYAATTKGGLKSNVKLNELYKDCNSAADFAAIFDWASDNTALADTIGQIINTKSNGIITSTTPISSTWVAGSGSTAGHYTLTVNDPGYYFIGDGDSTATTLYTDHYFLQIFNDDKTVAPKASTPSMEKKVYENTKYHSVSNNEYGTGFNDTADYSIGDYVPFKLIGTIPEMSAYNNGYQYQFHDTLSVSLTRPTGMYASSNVNGPRVYLAKNKDDVYINTTSGEFAVNADNVTEVTSSFAFTAGSDNDMYVSVSIGTSKTNDLRQVSGIYNVDSTTGQVIKNSDGTSQRSDYNYIIVVYKALLNERAAIGRNVISNNTLGNQHKTQTAGVSPNVGNVNVACLEYSNNPNTPSSHGDTDDDYVIVFTYKVDVTKASASDTNTKLGGATFYLLNSDKTKIAVLDSNYKFKRWAAYQQYQTGTSTLQTNGTTETLAAGETTTLTSASDTGLFSVTGLDDGVYALREVTPPEGYNTAQADWTITVSANTKNGQEGNGAESELDSIATAVTGGDKAVKYGTATLVGVSQDLVASGSVSSDVAKGTLSATITNTQGFQLPQTGGLGTMVLTIVGAALVAGAVLVLAIRKRANDGQ